MKLYLPGSKFVADVIAIYNVTTDTTGGFRPDGSSLLFTNTSTYISLFLLLAKEVGNDLDLMMHWGPSSGKMTSIGARFPTTIAASAGGTCNAGYYAHFGNYGDRLNLYRGTTSLGVYDLGATPDPIRTRFQCNGTALKAKVWDPGGSEPSWQIEVTDSTYTSGRMGIGTRASTYVHWIGIADYGETPPSSGSLRTISGNVKRAGSNQPGATIFLIRRGADLTKPLVPGIDIAKATTDSNGNYSVGVDTDAEDWFVVPDYETGGTYYSDIGKRVRWS